VTVVVTRSEDLDNGKVKPTDSIVFVREGIATAINSHLVAAGMHSLEEYCVQHGWVPKSAPMLEIQPTPVLLRWLKAWIQGG